MSHEIQVLENFNPDNIKSNHREIQLRIWKMFSLIVAQ